MTNNEWERFEQNLASPYGGLTIEADGILVDFLVVNSGHLKYEYFGLCWKSPKSLRRHLQNTCKQIQLIEPSMEIV